MTLWIRVDADVADNAKIGRFATKLGVEIETAVGHLVRLWGKMAEQKSDGKLAGVRAATIESWANWRGKKGRFADVFRRTFVVKGGIVKGWGERQGKLILKQIARAEYMREYREQRANGSRGARVQLQNAHGAPQTGTTKKPKDHTRPLPAKDSQPADVASVMQRYLAKTTRRAT